MEQVLSVIGTLVIFYWLTNDQIGLLRNCKVVTLPLAAVAFVFMFVIPILLCMGLLRTSSTLH